MDQHTSCVSQLKVNIKREHLPSSLIRLPYVGRARDPVLPSHRFKQNQNSSLKKRG